VTDRRLLIVNADDYGLTEQISLGIIRGHREGIVTSTSVLALGPAYPKVAPWLDDVPTLGVGVHLAAVGEDPPLLSAAEIPTLVDRRGHLYESYKSLIVRIVAGRVDPADIEREFTAQLESVLELGLPIGHLDAHQHLHLWPPVGKVVLDLACRFDIPAVRVPHYRGLAPLAAGVTILGRRLATRARAVGLRYPHDGTGIEVAGRLDHERLQSALARLAARGAPSVEVTVHPGEPDDPDRHRYDWGYRWPDELDALTTDAARAAVDRLGERRVQRSLRSSPAGWSLRSGHAGWSLRSGHGGLAQAPLGRTGTSTRRQVLSLYADAPASVRAHVAVRWATCPFRAVASQLPPGGRLLEVGCGHGVFSMLAAVTDHERTVVGVDVDERKVPHARAAASKARNAGASVDIAVAPPGELPDGPWDAVVVLDVLYLLDAATQRGLLAECAARLAPGGALAVKEMALTPRWKFRWNQAQEILAVKALGITVGGDMTFVDPLMMGEWMAADGLDVRHRPLHKGYPHPHHLVLGRSPAGAG